MKMQFSKKKFYWVSFIWFQAIWLLAVVYTDQAVLLLLLSLFAHFLVSPTRASDLLNLLAITLLGCAGDYLLTYIGVFTFTDHYFIPLWLILLWTHFAVTLNHGLSWLEKLPLYARILFGAVFGTLSYYAGYKMGAVTLHSNLLLSLFALSVIWATLLPVYTLLASLNRMRCDDDIKGTTHLP
ncbi:MAG: hypothetical protein ACJAT7_000438 [Psychromonas sp.]|jgi:hypothetical protein|uniref:DUF2878 domain-containing protein n=1 Tax=Psychromonas sp. TaxID=1884585 RepID=UPI0039E40FA6